MPHYVYKSLQSLLYGSFRIIPVTVEYVDIIKIHSLKTLIERCKKIFTGTPIAVRTGPHIETGLCGDDHFISVWHKR